MDRNLVGRDYVGHCRHRNRENAVLASYCAGSLVKSWNIDFIHSQVVKADCQGNNIHNGVDGSHLMEMDLLNGHIVGLGFSLGNDPEYTAGKSAGSFRHISFLYDGQHIGQVAVLMVMMLVVMMMGMLFLPEKIFHIVVMVLMILVQDDIKVAAVDASLLDSGDFYFKPLGWN